MALSTTQYGYIIDPMVPFTDGKGNTIKDGFVRVFVAGSSTPVVTYRNFDGAANQDIIELDNSGRTKTSVIGSKGLTYKVCVYDQMHSQESPILTVDKVSVIGANITAGSGATVVTGLDGLTTKPDGFVDASVIGTDGYVALDHTLVTDDLDTDAKATAVENDRYIPLLNEDVNDPDSKMTLGRLWQWVLGKIKSLSTTITAFRTGDVIPVDGPSGIAKMSKDDLLRVTAENALTDNVAPDFDESGTTNYAKGTIVSRFGKIYMFKVDHTGVWNADDVFPFGVDSVVRSIQNLNEIGSFEIESFDKFPFTPDFETGKIVSSSAYNSYVFDIGTGVVVDNIVVDGFTGIVQTDVIPKQGNVYAEGSRNAFTKMMHRYLVVCVDEDFAPTHCVVKARHISPFDNKENFDEKVGFLDKTLSSNAFLNLVPSSFDNKFASNTTWYNSYVFDVGSNCEFEIVSTGSAFVFSVQTDTFPKNGDSFSCLNRNSTGYTFHRYLTVVVDKEEPDLNIQVKLKGRGLSEKVLKLEQKSNVACKTFSSDTLCGIVPSSSSYEASNVYYDSFVFDIGVGKQYSIKVYGADFVLTTQEDSYPHIGDPLGSVRDRVTSGVMRKRYLVVCVDKENKSGIGCVVSVIGEGCKKLKALFIGNSVNQDHVMYAPWYLYNEYKDDLVFEIGNFYIASYTIKKYVENCVNGTTPADIYSTAYGTPTWTNVSNTELLADAIESNDWDIISVQGYFNNGVLGPEDMSYLADLVQFISDHATKPFTLAFMMHQTYTAGALARIIDGTKYAVKNNAVRLVFPCGFATEFVKGLWAHSFLTSDDIHNQEGLPCILGGYVVGDVLARYVGLPSRVMGNKKRMTSQEHSRLNIAGQNGSFQAGTNSQFEQAQIAACKAINAGYGVLSTAQTEMIPEE